MNSKLAAASGSPWGRWGIVLLGLLPLLAAWWVVDGRGRLHQLQRSPTCSRASVTKLAA